MLLPEMCFVLILSKQIAYGLSVIMKLHDLSVYWRSFNWPKYIV